MSSTTAENEAVTGRVHREILEEGRLELVDELYTEDAVIHGAVAGDVEGREAIAAYLDTMQQALAPVDVTEDIVVGEGDLVSVRRTDTYTHEGELFGVEPTGDPVTTTGHVIVRVEDGRVAEVWLASPILELLVQLGVVEPPMEDADP